MIWAEIWKIHKFFIWKFSVFEGEIFYILQKAVFIMGCLIPKGQGIPQPSLSLLNTKKSHWKHPRRLGLSPTVFAKNCWTVWQNQQIFILSCRKLQFVWQMSWFLAKRDSNLITDEPPVLQIFILSCQKFQFVWQLSCICWKISPQHCASLSGGKQWSVHKRAHWRLDWFKALEALQVCSRIGEGVRSLAQWRAGYTMQPAFSHVLFSWPTPRRLKKTLTGSILACQFLRSCMLWSPTRLRFILVELIIWVLFMLWHGISQNGFIEFRWHFYVNSSHFHLYCCGVISADLREYCVGFDWSIYDIKMSSK